MLQRIITSVIGLAVLFPILWFSDTIVFVIFIALLNVVSLYEMGGCIGFRKNYKISFPAYGLGIAVPIIARYLKKPSLFFAVFSMLLFSFLLYLIVLAVFSRGTFIINDAAMIFVMCLYILSCFTCILLLRDLTYGKYVYLLVFIGAWITDTFAYFCGRAFGKRKLIPDISPKKTVEGAIGGVVFCILAFLLYGFIIGKISSFSPNYIALAISGFIVSIVSQCGDLIASAVKRHYAVKDYGILFPGHGGVLDRFDSVMATAPFLLTLCSLPSFFVVFF